MEVENQTHYFDSEYRKSKRIYRTVIHVQIQLNISKGIENPTLHPVQKLIPSADLNMKSKEPKLLEDNIR